MDDDSEAPVHHVLIRSSLVLLLVATCLGLADPARAQQAPPPDRTTVLVLGDSISAPDLWQDHLRRRLADAGVAADVVTLGVAGASCWHLATLVRTALEAAQPDLVVFECGTNDDPTRALYGESETGWSFRYVVETIRAFRPADPVLVLPALVQYSDPSAAPTWLWAENEPRTNDTLWTNMQHYLHARGGRPWFTGVADLQRIPSTGYFLDPGGIHPTHEGHRVIGRIMYDEAAGAMGWPRSIEPPLCGLDGRRPGYPPPPFVPC